MAPMPDTLNSRTTEPFDLPSYLSSSSLAEREALVNSPTRINFLTKRGDDGIPILLPTETFESLTARDVSPTQSIHPGAGSIPPTDINMKGIQALFALIFAAFVVLTIWFFFWAKNGGFKWQKGDWEEYKSTVLRRKGPNGTTLSNATKSTKLGGGSVVGGGYSDTDGSFTMGSMTELSSEAPVMKEKQSRKKKETIKDRKLREANTAQWEGGHDNDVRAYRHERVARVGGLNKDSDAQYYGTDYSESAASDTQSNVHRQPTAQPAGPRNPSRPSSRQPSPDKRQSRRDFSYTADHAFNTTGDDAPPPPPRPTRYHSPSKQAPQYDRRQVPGNYNGSDISDVQSQNTRSYHHPIPGLSGGQGRPQGGYRRDRRDSLDD